MRIRISNHDFTPEGLPRYLETEDEDAAYNRAVSKELDIAAGTLGEGSGLTITNDERIIRK